MQNNTFMLTDEYDLPLAVEPSGVRTAPTGRQHAIYITITLFALLLAGGCYWLTGSALVAGATLAIIMMPLFFFEPFFALCLLVSLSPFDMATRLGQSFTVSKALGIGFVLAFVANAAIGRYRFYFPKLLVTLMGLLIWCILTVLWSPYAAASAIAVTSLWNMGVMLIIACSIIKTQAHLRQLVKYIVGGVLLLSIYSLVGARTAYSVYSGRLELESIDTNHMMYAVSFGAFCTGYLLFGSRGMIRRSLLLAALLFLCGISLMGQSRGILLASTMSLVMAALLTFYRNPSRLMLVLIGIFFLGVVALIAGFEYVWTDVAQERMSDLLTRGGSTGRFDIWRRALALWREHPFEGRGFGIARYLPRMGQDVHNNYIATLLETGMIGLFLWLTMLLLFFLRAISVKQPTLLRFFALTLIFAAVLTGMTVNTVVSKTAWYQLAIVLAASQLPRTSVPDSQWLSRPHAD